MEDNSWIYVIILVVLWIGRFVYKLHKDSVGEYHEYCPKCGYSLYREENTLEYSQYCPKCGHKMY